MLLKSLPSKLVLTALIAYGGIEWLKLWHRFVYTRSAIIFPPFSSWLRDLMIVLVPVLLAVWIGIGLLQWIIDHFGRRMSASWQSILTAITLGGVTSLSFVLVEANQIFRSGLGSEFSFLASICGRIYPKGNLLLLVLRWVFPVNQAFRIHILLQDGLNLALINMAITIVLILVLEGFVKVRNVYEPETL
jgi:hypothetical protein